MFRFLAIKSFISDAKLGINHVNCSDIKVKIWINTDWQKPQTAKKQKNSPSYPGNPIWIGKQKIYWLFLPLSLKKAALSRKNPRISDFYPSIADKNPPWAFFLQTTAFLCRIFAAFWRKRRNFAADNSGNRKQAWTTTLQPKVDSNTKKWNDY